MMRSLVPLSVAVSSVVGLVAPALAGGGDPPNPAPWTAPALIPVVGLNAAGVPDPVGEIAIVARDIANNPIPGVPVVIDFSGCSEVRLSADPHDPDAVVDCVQRTVRKATDAAGVVRFRVVGCSVAVPGTPGSPWSCARIYGDGALVASPSVAIYDLAGCDGLNPGDLAAWLADFYMVSPSRIDYDGSGAVGPADLSRWLAVFFAAGSVSNCGAVGRCP